MNMPSEFLTVVRKLEVERLAEARRLGYEPVEPAWSLVAFRTTDDVVFPPFGFVAFPDFDEFEGCLGNGDHDGFYWPIGREDQPPLVARTAHDHFGMIPVASSFEKFLELDALATAEDERERARKEANPSRHRRAPYAPDALAERLAVDPDSPYLQTAVADLAASEGDLDRAEGLYRAALDRIPEYTAARIGLALLLRRNRRGVEALGHMLKALRSPIPLFGTFWFSTENLPTERVNRDDYRRKFLYWIQRIEPKAAGEHADDPLYQVRDRLTFASGVKETGDYKVFDELIEAYIDRNEPIEAVGLAMVHNESMAGETISFRERSAETEAAQRARLLRTFQAAGLTARTEWLTSLPAPKSP